MTVRRITPPLTAPQIRKCERSDLRRRMRLEMCSMLIAPVLSGCLATPAPPETPAQASAETPPKSGITEVATEVDPATTQPSYWLDLAALSVSSNNFDRLWQAAEETARDFGFTIDRTDYRAGVLTTVPLTSAQWFEFWRSDIRHFDALVESSTATVRRTIRFEFVRADDGTYKCYPRVLVERQAIAEQRITSVASYQSVYRRPLRPRDRPRGTRESDEGVLLPSRYWYPTGRDQSLEAGLIDAMRKKL